LAGAGAIFHLTRFYPVYFDHARAAAKTSLRPSSFRGGSSALKVITKNGYNWTDRFPWIVQAALNAPLSPTSSLQLTSSSPHRLIDGAPQTMELTFFRAVMACASWRSGLNQMHRPLVVLAFCSLCTVPQAASAHQAKAPHQISDFSSRHRCVCGPPRARFVEYRRHYRVRSAYLIGYDPLPYRFGSTFVFEPPYRYYR
jgi:hypothetical protein